VHNKGVEERQAAEKEKRMSHCQRTTTGYLCMLIGKYQHEQGTKYVMGCLQAGLYPVQREWEEQNCLDASHSYTESTQMKYKNQGNSRAGSQTIEPTITRSAEGMAPFRWDKKALNFLSETTRGGKNLLLKLPSERT